MVRKKENPPQGYHGVADEIARKCVLRGALSQSSVSAFILLRRNAHRFDKL